MAKVADVGGSETQDAREEAGTSKRGRLVRLDNYYTIKGHVFSIEGYRYT